MTSRSGKNATRLAVLAVGVLLLALALWLWDRQGVMVWLQGAIAYCF